MSKLRKRIDDPRQKNLFDFIKEQIEKPPTAYPGDYNIQTQLKHALSEALKQCTLSRYHVAARMSELLGTEITKWMLDTWTAESKEFHRFPAEYLPAFCEAVGSMGPLDLIARKSRAFLFRDSDALRAEVQKNGEKIKGLQVENRKMRVFISAQEGLKK